MRTSKSATYIFILLLYLCCFVQQCHLLMFGLLSTSVANGVSSALTMTSAIGMTMMSSMMQSFISTFAHGFSTLHTMWMSIISGFMMGNLFLAGFIFLLLALVPAEEEFRSLGGSSIFNSPIFRSQHRGTPLLLPYLSPEILNSTGLDRINENITLARNKRSLPTLVNRNNANATNISITLPSSSLLSSSSTSRSSLNNGSVTKFQYNLRFALERNDSDLSLLSGLNGTDARIPRFLTRLVQRDPFNCLPLLLCGLSAARKPSERTEVLNDYAYLLKEFMEPDEDKSDDSEEDDLPTSKNKNRFRQEDAIELFSKLVSGQKKKDEVDKVIDEMRKEEDDKIEDLALTAMADDPNDLKFALEDMKVRGLTKTMSKMSNESKKNYVAQLMKEESEEEGEVYSEEVPMEMMGHYPRNEFPPGSFSREKNHYYDLRDLTKGGYPPLPPAPAVPEYGLTEDMLYKKNLKILDDSLSDRPPPLHRRRMPLRPPPPFPPHGRRMKRESQKKNGPPPRGFLQKKRGEAAAANNIFDRARVGAEVGARAGNNRQCRALFSQCPVDSLIRPVGDSNTPFLNRAVNNIRRVILGTPAEGSKQRRVNEIKQVIEQMHPRPLNHGGSEVRVVLNIGPSPPPTGPDVHRAGGSPPPGHYNLPPNYEISLPTPQPTLFSAPQNDYSQHYTSFKNPSRLTTKRPVLTTVKPDLKPTKKLMKYKKPSLPSPRPTKDLSDLEKLLKGTSSSVNSDEESTTDYPQEETTIISYADGQESIEYAPSGEMENEPVLPTSFPISKEEYAQNLRETFDIFKRFKEANKNPFQAITTSKTTVRPRSTTTKKSSLKLPNGKVPSIKPGLGASDQPEQDIDHESDDVQSILDWIKKFRQKYSPKAKDKRKKNRNKKKRKKKKKNKDSSEESSEEHDPHHHHHHNPTLVAVPHPHLKHQFYWKSSTTSLKDGIYHFFFGGRQTRPLPKSPHHFHPHDESNEVHFHKKPIRHDVHYHEPPSPPVIHHHRLRNGELDATEEVDVGPTTLPPPPSLSSTRTTVSTSKPKTNTKSKSSKGTKKPSVLVATRRPIKIKLKTPKPIILPESNEDDPHMFRALPPPPPPPRLMPMFDESMESYEDDRDGDYFVGPTRPQLMYSPFTLNAGRRPSRPSKTKKKGTKKSSVSSGRSLSKRINKSSTAKSKASSNRTTSTVKPKRKILKYKNG